MLLDLVKEYEDAGFVTVPCIRHKCNGEISPHNYQRDWHERTSDERLDFWGFFHKSRELFLGVYPGDHLVIEIDSRFRWIKFRAKMGWASLPGSSIVFAPNRRESHWFFCPGENLTSHRQYGQRKSDGMGWLYGPHRCVIVPGTDNRFSWCGTGSILDVHAPMLPDEIRAYIKEREIWHI